MTATLTAVPIGELHSNPTNHRVNLGDRDSLTASIKELGVIEPLIVTPRAEGGYLIIAGHRRHASATDAGLDSVPCVVRDSVDALTGATEMLHENIVRRDLSPAEAAKGIQQILDLGGNIKAVASALNTTQKVVKAYAAASTLAESTQEALHVGRLTLEQAIDLGPVEAHPDIFENAMSEIARDGNGSWAVKQALQAVAKREAQVIVDAYAAEHGCQVTDKYGHESNCRRLKDADEIIVHRGLPCYAVGVDTQDDTNIRHLCTNQANHHKGADVSAEAVAEASEASKAERRRVIANNKAWDTANEIRLAWIKEFRTRKSAPKGALLPMVRLMAMRVPDGAEVHHAMVQINADFPPYWPTTDDVAATLTTDATALRALVLAVVANRENAISKQVWRDGNAATAYYLETLATWGYTLTPPEALYVTTVNAGGKTAEVDYPTTDAN